ncbi:MAG: hypothetical protein KGJ02_00600 [Verrucomicrobiota bacterium]|nr:hypothetical protein [Verrucomicrobiota bacterium]
MTTKFHTLQPWLEEILSTIKKDIKTDYLPAFPALHRAHFGNRPLNRLSTEELLTAFSKELLQGNEDLAEWVVNRWVFKHGEVYSHFAERLLHVNPNFEAIQELTPEQTEKILHGALETFGAKQVYFFSLLNGVVFPPAVFERLRKAAEMEETQHKAKQASEAEQQQAARTAEQHQREVARLTEKYEQKLAGVLKKYTTDVEALKKQVRALQQQLNDR